MNSMLDDNFERQFFSYVLDRTVPANAIQDPNALQILSDADHEWWWVIGSATAPTQLRVQMKEEATGRFFMGTSPQAQASGTPFNGILMSNWCGTAQGNASFPLAVPYILPATRVYSFYFTDSSGAPNVTQLVLSGFKLWPRPSVQ